MKSEELQYEYLNLAYRELEEAYHMIAATNDVSDGAMWILYAVRESGGSPVTQAEIAETMFMNRQTVNSAIRHLETKNCVRLESIENNRKNKRIVLTERGEALARKTVDLIIGCEKRAFGSFTEHERASFLELNKKFVKTIKGLLENGEKNGT